MNDYRSLFDMLLVVVDNGMDDSGSWMNYYYLILGYIGVEILYRWCSLGICVYGWYLNIKNLFALLLISGFRCPLLM